MKTTLQLDTLHLRLRGIPPSAATAAVRDLGAALARQLASGPAGAPAALPPHPTVAAVRQAVVARTAAALRPHLAPPP